LAVVFDAGPKYSKATLNKSNLAERAELEQQPERIRHRRHYPPDRATTPPRAWLSRMPNAIVLVLRICFNQTG
jgi:hypothetical protein